MKPLVASGANAVQRWTKTVFAVALGILLCCGAYLFIRACLFFPAHYYLPPQQRVVQQFESNRADYIRFVNLLRKDPSVRSVGGDGKVDRDGMHGRLVPEYRDLMGKIGAKYVIVRGDGSMEFELWGDGCAICSDSYMGVRYYPKDPKTGSPGGWEQTVVTSLDSAKLPQEKGAVATGLYVVPIEPDWFVYRLEYQE